MIRIIVAEDNKIVRQGIIGLLDDQPDMKVVGEAENGLQALELLKGESKTDILLTDLNMPGMDGLALTEMVRAKYPEVRVIILTMHLRPDFIDKALVAGAKGYILKDGNFDDLYEGIRKVFAGDSFVTAGL